MGLRTGRSESRRDRAFLIERPEPRSHLRRQGLIAAAAAVVIALDQLTKWWATETLPPDIDLFWTLRFHLVFNRGSAFSLAAGRGPILGVLAILVALGLLWAGRRTNDRVLLITMGCVAGGALGNLIDRFARADDGILSGGVVDFVDFQWWPIFNVADVAITVGGLAFVLFSSRLDQPDQLDQSGELT